MHMKYDSLFTLLNENQEAQKYFNSLPEYVKDSIRERAEGVNSFESLRDYADNLTREDD